MNVRFWRKADIFGPERLVAGATPTQVQKLVVFSLVPALIAGCDALSLISFIGLVR